MKIPKPPSKPIEDYLKTLKHRNFAEHYIREVDSLLYRLNKYKSVETIELGEDLHLFYDTLKVSPKTLEGYKSIINQFLEYKVKEYHKKVRYYRPVVDELIDEGIFISPPKK